MGANNHLTVDAELEKIYDDRVDNISQEPEWAVWINRNGFEYKLPFNVEAINETEALIKAKNAVSRVLDGVGVSYKRGSNYDVEVRKIIE